MAIERVIGIDFGTSTSVVKVKNYMNGEPMEDTIYADSVSFDRNSTVPTVVFVTENGEYLCGHEVKSRSEKGVLYTNFKMDLISEDEDKREKARTLVLKFFEYLHRTYLDQKEYFNPNKTQGISSLAGDYIIEKTYISYPAKWPEDVRRLMVTLAEKAGFKNVKGLDEPTAAIHTMMVQSVDMIQKEKLLLPGETAHILMIDMGAGTTDLALCRYTLDKKTQPDILITWPTADNKVSLGGREFDQRLCEYTKEYLRRCGLTKLDKFSSPQNLDNFKVWKETTLSPALAQDQIVGEPGFLPLYKEMLPFDFPEFPPINRRVFESIIEDSLMQFSHMINQCIKEAVKLDKGFKGGEDVDFVVLTGGHSQWYFVREMILDQFYSPKVKPLNLPKVRRNENRIIQLSKPQETVALGLVYQPMNVEVKNCATNSVWVQFAIDSVQTDIRQVIFYGDPLPCQRELVTKFTVHQSYLKLANLFQCNIRCGESLVTALLHTHFGIVPKGAWAQFIDIVFSPLNALFNPVDSKEFTIKCIIEMDSNQCTTIRGTVSATGNSAQPVKFEF